MHFDGGKVFFSSVWAECDGEGSAGKTAENEFAVKGQLEMICIANNNVADRQVTQSSIANRQVFFTCRIKEQFAEVYFHWFNDNLSHWV